MKLPQSIRSAVDKVAKQSLGRDWTLYAALLEHWAEIVGSDYAEVTSPVKISFPKGKVEGESWATGHRTDGVLHIRLPQGLTMVFSTRTGQIISRITAYFGYPAVSRIQFEPFYAVKIPEKTEKVRTEKADLLLQQMKDQTKDIDNNELKERLQALAEVVSGDESR